MHKRCVQLARRCLPLLLVSFLLQTAVAQSEQAQSSSQSVQTESVPSHAVEDVQNTQSAISAQPSDVQDAAAARLSAAIQKNPDVSDATKQFAREHPKEFLNFDPKKLKSQDLDIYNPQIQQVLDPSLIPVAVLQNQLIVFDPQGKDNPLVKAIISKQAALIKEAASVGRIEIANAQGSPQLVGTAFVVSSGYVMTACHVAEAIAKRDVPRGGWNLTATTYIDFGATTQHVASQEFVVKSVQKMSSVSGFDVAVLQVESKSRDHSKSLPPSLDLALNEVNGQIPIGVIGYPALDDPQGTQATLETMSKLKIAEPLIAKYVSPGQVLADEPRSSFHVLVHVGSTHAGNSGSPVFSLDPIQVVGIHYCCTGLDQTSQAGAQETGDCSSTTAANIHANEAISAADARALVPGSSPTPTMAVNAEKLKFAKARKKADREASE